MMKSGKYDNDFVQGRVIGVGDSDTRVFEVVANNDRNTYAIKKYYYREGKDHEYNELSARLVELTGIESDYLVMCFETWTETVIYVQMEQCFGDLEYIMKKRTDFFKTGSDAYELALIDYFISFEMFEEITQSLNFLHTLNPPVIHRDLKPTNVLISEEVNRSGHFLRLSDFGYATVRDDGNQTVATFSAPEVLTNKRFELNSDIYSLALIGQELFDINVVTTSKTGWSKQMMKKHEKLRPLYAALEKPFQCLLNTVNPTNRFTSQQTLNYITRWQLGVNELNVIAKRVRVLTSTKPRDAVNRFFQNYLKTKIDLRFGKQPEPTRGSADVDSALSDLVKQLEYFGSESKTTEIKKFPISEKSSEKTSRSESEKSSESTSGSGSEDETGKAGNYAKRFQQKALIGGGSYGKVYEVMNKADKVVYAIKIFEPNISGDEELREIEKLMRIRNEFVVQYITVWREFQRTYLQMEYCSGNLRQFMQMKSESFSGGSGNYEKGLADYFTSCELFVEIGQSLNILHTNNPPIVHRNLKPENVLIAFGNKKSNHFLKLSDFGYAKPPTIRGKYKAPEVLHIETHEVLSDIYSLGIIGQELFGIDVYRQEWNLEARHQRLRPTYAEFKTLFEQIVYSKWWTRPTCEHVVNQTIGLQLGETQVKDIKDSYKVLVSASTQENVKTIFKDFLRAKLKLRLESKSDSKKKSKIKI